MSALAVLVRPDDDRAACGEVAHPWHHERISSPPPDLSALFARVQRGDQDAFAELYDAIAPMVFGAVKRILRDPAMSEEVTQEVFVELWTSAARFDPTRAWCRRGRSPSPAGERSTGSAPNSRSATASSSSGRRRPDVEEATDDTVVASLDAERVSRALAELPTDQRQIIQLAFIDGYSHSDIAEQLGLPLGTVKGRVRGGLQRLSGKLGGVA